MIFVTGGAGFIGSNFVLDWLCSSRRSGRQPRQAHLCRQPGEPRCAARQMHAHVRARRHRRYRPGRAACCRSIRPARRSSTSPPRATSTARSTGPANSFRPTSWAPSACWKLRALTGTGWLPSGSRRSASCTSRPTRSTARSAQDAAVHRNDALRAEQPVLGQQGRDRPPGARLPPHLRPAGADHQLLEQLRPVSVPREADPADDRSTRWTASRCRSTATASKSATGCMSRTTARRSARCSKRASRARPTTSAAGTRRPTSRSCTPICDIARRTAPQMLTASCTRPDHLRQGPPRPRPALRHRRQPRSSASSAGSRPRPSRPASQDRALVSGQPARGWPTCSRGAYRDWMDRTQYAAPDAQR